ncbi:MAG: MnhB domain-containing protein, partial [Mesorhizobium sp.]|nr:MnhB domain-containing protein [Mesorhizobium sp.]
DYPSHPHDPPAGMWVPVAVLVVLVVAIGLLPALIAGPIVERTALAVIGAPLPAYYLAIWHGVTEALIVSLGAIAAGAALFLAYDRVDAFRVSLPRPEAKAMFDRVIAGAVALSQSAIARTHTGSLQLYVAIVLLATVLLAAAGFWTASHGAGARETLPMSLPAAVAWIALVTASLAAALRHHDRIFALVLTSVVGLMVTLAFLQFSAPDLALTQISVDVVTTILLLLALNLLPKTTPRETRAAVRWRDAGIASVAGLGIGALAYAVMTRDFDSISAYHLAQSKPGGGGTNVVNVILVDFRGFDTFGEIIVLGIAAITIFALLDHSLRGAAARRLASIRTAAEARDAHPLMLVVATRALLPLALTVGAYIFLRGHNLPGGGFIAGLVVAIALIMQYMASGYVWANERARVDSQAMIGAGIAIAGFTGIGSFVFGRPFLTSAYDYFSLPLVGKFELATAMAFDLGVFLTVVGVVLLSLSKISRVQQRAERSPHTSSPMDIILDSDPVPAAAGAPAPKGG